MSKPVVIVESPNKIKKLKSYKGDEYEFHASVGHFRDLPTKSIGVFAPEYKPEYVVTKKDVVKKLKAACKGKTVYLAADLDREGEAIAWHLVDELKLKDYKRVTYKEITKKALDDAFNNPRDIDHNLVKAQESRRVLDRLVGYKVSSALSNLTGSKDSAGRVQTPALRIIVDREREIENFKTTNHFGVEAVFETDHISWKAEWDFKPYIKKEEKYWLDAEKAEHVATAREFIVVSVNKEQKSTKPPAPFTTSTLQQAASISLKMNTKRTMEVAQQLFADGLITYMRTDSCNLSDEAIDSVWKYLGENSLKNYIPESANKWKSKAGAQEAHEAIRPTDFNKVDIESDDKDQIALYQLIWQRAVACQMKSAEYDITKAVLQAVDVYYPGETESIPIIFNAQGKSLTFDGWTKITTDKADEEEDTDQLLPSLEENKHYQSEKTVVVSKQTKPPSRYSEAALVKALEAKGIGRPSTFASIIDTLRRRGYTIEEKRKLKPTEQGKCVRDALVGKFSFAEYGYTKELEKQLDDIAEGKASYLPVVSKADIQIDLELKQLSSVDGIEKIPCPNKECDGHLRRIPAKGKFFFGCSNYPNCKETRPDDNGRPGEKIIQKGSDEFKCKICDSGLIRRPSKKGKGFWWGCSGFPTCKQTYPDKNNKPVF